ncbi:MAG: response regulator transcription factor [Lysobacterales bacterium]|nr:response regulator transcription factor [Xanthomonadales bacterium]MCB1613723.1 response regulator transcription factor [Xanthomonadales bacterium]MCP5474979.1 response regulator transcription factor [Rhodanobacteraceae bacterium]
MAATDSDQQIRVGIVEDHADLRAALEQTLQSAPDFCLSFSAEDLAQARRLMVQDFDLLILDLSLPDGLGTTLIPDLRRRLRPPKIVAHTVFDDEGSVIRAIEAGVDGYVLKSTAAEALFAALHAAMRGEAPISPAVARYLLKRLRQPTTAQTPGMTELTPRERDVLECLARGNSYRESAELLNISTNTVAHHAKNVYSKLAANSCTEAVYRAVQSGLISLE